MAPVKRLIIAVDRDDVIVASALAILKYYHETYGIEVLPAEAYSNDPRIWGVTHADERIERITEYLKTVEYQQLPPIRDAISALRKLKKHHEIHLVTGRVDFLRAPTLAWLDEHFPDVFASTEFTNFIVTAENKHITRSKAEVCNQLAADIFIEDHPHHAQLVADTGVQVLLFGDYPWNRDVELTSPNITRVKDWDLVLEYIQHHEQA